MGRHPLVKCACGCGELLASRDDHNRQRRYVSGHNSRGRVRRVYQDAPVNYPREGTARVHRMRAERALGRPLPVGVLVHHADGSKREDSPLIICPDDAYHRLLHARARVLAAGGDPNTEIICKDCHQLTPRIGPRGGKAERCPPCGSAHTIAYKARLGIS